MTADERRQQAILNRNHEIQVELNRDRARRDRAIELGLPPDTSYIDICEHLWEDHLFHIAEGRR